MIALEPIGWVRGGRSEPTDDDWGAVLAAIELDETRFSPDSVSGLEEFSHLEAIFLFDRVQADEIETGARRPRGRQDWPLVGIFAQRGRTRPNRLGLCACRILGVAWPSIEVEGLDAIDGTPVFDIKPVMTGFLPRGEIREPIWADQIMRRYW